MQNETSKHTPGKWFLSQDGHAVNTGMNGANVALLCVPQCHMGGNKKSNGRLIATAPELLSALEALVTGDGQTLKSSLVDKAYAAIEKATSQTL